MNTASQQLSAGATRPKRAELCGPGGRARGCADGAVPNWSYLASAETGAVCVPPVRAQSAMQDGETVILRLRPSIWSMIRRTWITALALLIFAIVVLRLLVTGQLTAQPLPGVALTGAIGAMVGLIAILWIQWSTTEYVLTDRRAMAWGRLPEWCDELPLTAVRRVAIGELHDPSMFGRRPGNMLGTLHFLDHDDAVCVRWVAIAQPERIKAQVDEAIRRYARGELSS